MPEVLTIGSRLVWRSGQKEEARGVVVSTYDDEGAWVVVRMDVQKQDYVRNPDTGELDRTKVADNRVFKLGDGDSLWERLKDTGWNELQTYHVLKFINGHGFASESRTDLEKAKEILEAACQKVYDEYYDQGFAGSDLSIEIVAQEEPV
jgi:hypothetical protein